MRIVVAPNAYKGSLSASQAAAAMAQGIRRATSDAQVDLVPIADGGDGTVEALVAAAGGSLKRLGVRGPLGDRVEAEYGLIDSGRTAVIEMARAAGLSLVPADRRDPAITTTFGVGQLLQDARDRGVDRFIVGIGGSATNDGGAGMAQALGYHLLDEEGLELTPGGLALERLSRIHLGGVYSDWSAATVQVASDVTNPLTGPEGASAVYGPQKGASPALVDRLDAALRRLAAVIQRDLGKDVERIPGAGAAGGLGAGLIAFTGARLQPGAEMVLDALRFNERLEGAALVLTGEGRIDFQTARFGKGPAAVARRSRAAGVPVIGIGGQVEEDAELLRLFDQLVASSPGGMPLDQALGQARSLLVETTARVVAGFLRARA